MANQNKKDAKELTYNGTKLEIELDASSFAIGKYLNIASKNKNGEQENITLVVNNIHYKKEIYKPGHAEIEFIFKNRDNFQGQNYVNTIKSFFYPGEKKVAKLDIKNSDNVLVVNGYWLRDISFKQDLREIHATNTQGQVIAQKQNVFLVILKACSPDYFLTLKKYSKVYFSKKLSSILRTKLEADDNMKELLPNNENLRLCHTTYTLSNVEMEMIQPYLVQYNESFHDFMVRTANRCGELFYYENGKIILGVDKANLTEKGDTDTIKVKDALTNDELTYAKLTSSELKTKTYNVDSPADLSYSLFPNTYEEVSEAFHKNFINNNYSGTEALEDNKDYIDDDVTLDENLEMLKKDDTTEMWINIMEAEWFGVGSSALAGEGWADALNSGFSTAVQNLTDAASIMVTIPDGGKKGVLLTEEEAKDSNKWHNAPAEISKDAKEKITKWFKTKYMENHPDEFVKSSDTDPWTESTSAASTAMKVFNALLDSSESAATSLKNVMTAYEKTNPDEFHHVTYSDDAWGKDGSLPYQALQKVKGSLNTTTEDSFFTTKKQEYEKNNAAAFHLEDLWTKTDAPAYESYQEFLKSEPSMLDKNKWQTDFLKKNNRTCYNYLWKNSTDLKNVLNGFVSEWKKEYKKNNLDQFKVVGEAMTDQEKLAHWQDKESNAHKKLSENQALVLDTATSYVKDNPTTFAGCTTPDAVWTKLTTDETVKNSFIEALKKKYKETHPDEFTKKTVPIDVVAYWDNKENKGPKQLEQFKDQLSEKNLNNKFYSWIAKIEKYNSEHIHTDTITSNVPSNLLGEFVNLNGTADDSTFIVFGVETNICSKVQDYKEVIDKKTVHKLSKTEKNVQRGESFAYQFLVFPPLSEIPHILKSTPQQAIVTSTDDPMKLGRVQVQYPWSKETKSPWLPIMMPFSGNDSSGFNMIPDTNEYVILNYEGGNIERPYVEGFVYHDDAGKMAWGCTEVAARDWKWTTKHRSINVNGSGLTFVSGNASNFWSGMVPNIFFPIFDGIIKNKFGGNKAVWDMSSKNLRLGNGLILGDYYGIYSISMSSAKRSIDISSPWGKVNIDAFQGITLEAPNGDIKISGKNVTIEAGNEVKITSGKNIKGTKKFDISDAVGSSLGGIFGSALRNISKGATGIDVSKLLDVSFLRSVLEIGLRPVGGTLSIKSKRNVTIEAGQGSVVVPAETLSMSSKPKTEETGKFILNPFKNLSSIAHLDDSKVNKTNKETTDKNTTGGNVYKFLNAECAVIDEYIVYLMNTHCNSAYVQLTDLLDDDDEDDEDDRLIKEGWRTFADILEKAANDTDFVKENVFKVQANPVGMEEEDEEDRNNRVQINQQIDNLFNIMQPLYDRIQDAYQSFTKLIQLNVSLQNAMGLVRVKTKDVGLGDADEEARIGEHDFIKNTCKSAVLDTLLRGDDAKAKFTAFISTEDVDENKAIVAKNLKKMMISNFLRKSTYVMVFDANGKKIDHDDVKITDVGLNGHGLPLADDGNTWNMAIARCKIRPNTFTKANNDAKDEGRWSWNTFFSQMAAGTLGDTLSYDSDKDKFTLFKSAHQLLNSNGIDGTRSTWDLSTGGALLLSSKKDTTIQLTDKCEIFEKVKTNDENLANIVTAFGLN